MYCHEAMALPHFLQVLFLLWLADICLTPPTLSLYISAWISAWLYSANPLAEADLLINQPIKATHIQKDIPHHTSKVEILHGQFFSFILFLPNLFHRFHSLKQS